MPGMFGITAATNTVQLDNRRQAETLFTVFNGSGRPVRGRARVVPLNPVSERWLTLLGEAERDFPAAGTQQYTVQITAPPDAMAGSYPFRLDMVGVENPDEELTQGPSVTFEVPAPKVVKKSFPIWIPIAAIVALLLLGCIVGALLLFNNNRGEVAATPTPTPTRGRPLINATMFAPDPNNLRTRVVQPQQFQQPQQPPDSP